MTKKKDPKDFLKQGAPTKYKDDIPQKMIDFFNRPLMKAQQVEVLTKTGQIKLVTEMVANELPTIEKFCCDLMISKETLHQWIKKYPVLTDAYKFAKQAQKNHLMQNGLSGNYNSAFAKFVAINCTDLVDKVVTEHQGNIEIVIDNDDSAL
jgi:hypothetical protein